MATVGESGMGAELAEARPSIAHVREKKQLYVGCGLTLAPEHFKDEVGRLKVELAKDWHVMEFLGLGPAGPGDVYQKDIIENVHGCDAFLGIIDEPSWGLGWESREATILGKPALLVHKIGSKVTRLATDAPLFVPGLRVATYEDMVRDVPSMVNEEFAHVLQAA